MTELFQTYCESAADRLNVKGECLSGFKDKTKLFDLSKCMDRLAINSECIQT